MGGANFNQCQLTVNDFRIRDENYFHSEPWEKSSSSVKRRLVHNMKKTNNYKLQCVMEIPEFKYD